MSESYGGEQRDIALDMARQAEQRAAEEAARRGEQASKLPKYVGTIACAAY